MDLEQRMPDHDLLITLNTKVDQLTIDLRDMKDSIVTRVIKVESRLDAMDIYHASIPLTEYTEDAKWVEGVRSNMKFIIPLGFGFMSVVAGLVARIVQIWLHI